MIAKDVPPRLWAQKIMDRIARGERVHLLAEAGAREALGLPPPEAPATSHLTDPWEERE